MDTFWKQKTCTLNTAQQAWARYLAKSFHIDSFIIHHLLANGIEREDAMRAFLFPSMQQFHDPFTLPDMKKAVCRIILALKQQQPIIIFGDYDVDGMTSTALLAKALRFFGGCVHTHIPLREEGYGLSVSFIQHMQETYPHSLLITVDNGSSSHEAVTHANKLGIDVIITDHHEVLQRFPDAYAFVNPKRADNHYPFAHLAGVGVAFKVVEALFKACNRPWSVYMWEYIEFACIGTVADMMPLRDENRAFVALGLQKLNNQPAPIFARLMQRLYLTTLTSSDISFRLAPLLNSMGRLDDAHRVVRLFLTQQIDENEIDTLFSIDKKRKQLTETQFQMIETQMAQTQSNEHPMIIVQGAYAEGIIGILAARITNKYHKPTIVITQNGKASCRTGQHPHFSMIDALTSAQDHLLRFGGHRQAAGFSLDLMQLDAFRQAMFCYTQQLPSFNPTQWYDAVLPITQFTPSFGEELSLLEPFGVGNPKPIFYSPNTTVSSVHYFGSSKQYCKWRHHQNELLCFQKTPLMRELEHVGAGDLLYTFSQPHEFLIEDIAHPSRHQSFIHAI